MVYRQYSRGDLRHYTCVYTVGGFHSTGFLRQQWRIQDFVMEVTAFYKKSSWSPCCLFSPNFDNICLVVVKISDPMGGAVVPPAPLNPPLCASLPRKAHTEVCQTAQ